MWLHSTETKDFIHCLTTLLTAFWPYTLEGLDVLPKEYRKTHPVPEHIVQYFTSGFPDGSARKFIRELERRLPTLDTEVLLEVSRALENLCGAAKWGRSDADDTFIRTICRSQELFDGLFLSLREPDMVAPSAGYGRNAFSVWVVILVETIIRKLVNEWAGQREPFIRLCRKARLIDALESIFVHGPHVFLTLSTLFLHVFKHK